MIISRPTAKTHIGVGLYSFADAAQIAGLHPATLGHWVDQRKGLIPRFLDPAEKTLTFVELMELHFIKLFRAEGVSLQTIRKASTVAAKRFKTDYPFCVKRFDTDGRTIFATLAGKDDSNTELVEDLRRSQYVFASVLRPFFKRLDYRGSMEVSRYWPLEKSGGIVLDPKRKFGKPIVADCGITTRSLFDAFEAGKEKTVTSVAKWFDVPVSAVESAVTYEESLRREVLL
jgi:uncharacterized protein (DUF433 family)/DNA-binding transcriptional MerR regulator